MEMKKKEIKSKIKSKIPSSILPEIQKIHVILLNFIYMLRYVIQNLTGNFGIRFLVLSVGQACNYKCKDCANFCPVSPKEYKRYELDDILESIKRILKNVNFIQVFQIQGGEPFLYSELGGVLEYLGNRKDKIHQIVIATNGSIVPDDKLMYLIHKHGVQIRISDYGRFPEKLELLQQKCYQFKVQFTIYGFATGDSSWFQCGEVGVKRERDDNLVRNRFRCCAFKNCLTLERGELSHCSRASNSYHIQGFKRQKNDFIKVTDDKNFGKYLRRYVIFPKPMEACYYCYGTSLGCTIPAAIQEGDSGTALHK